MKIVISTGHLGYLLSDVVTRQYLHKKNIPYYEYNNIFDYDLNESFYVKRNESNKKDPIWFFLSDLGDRCESACVDAKSIFFIEHVDRHDLLLIELIEKIGLNASFDLFGDNYGYSLKIVEIPDGTEYIIVVNCNGTEHVAETHRTWR